MDFPNDLVTLGIQGHVNMMYSSTWHHRAAQQRGIQSSSHVPAEDPPASEPLPSAESQPWAESQPKNGVIYICSPSQRIRICGLFLQEEGLLVSESTQAAQKTTVLGWASVCIIIAAQLGQRGYIIWKMRQHQNPKLSRLNQKEM